MRDFPVAMIDFIIRPYTIVTGKNTGINVIIIKSVAQRPTVKTMFCLDYVC